MKLVRTRYAATVVAACGIIAVLGSGTASAAPTLLEDPALVNTSCSFSQFDRALWKAAPDVWQVLQRNPVVTKRVSQLLAMPPAQRRSTLALWRSSQPDMFTVLQDWEQKFPSEVRSVRIALAATAQTCQRF